MAKFGIRLAFPKKEITEQSGHWAKSCYEMISSCFVPKMPNSRGVA